MRLRSIFIVWLVITLVVIGLFFFRGKALGQLYPDWSRVEVAYQQPLELNGVQISVIAWQLLKPSQIEEMSGGSYDVYSSAPTDVKRPDYRALVVDLSVTNIQSESHVFDAIQLIATNGTWQNAPDFGLAEIVAPGQTAQVELAPGQTVALKDVFLMTADQINSEYWEMIDSSSFEINYDQYPTVYALPLK